MSHENVLSVSKLYISIVRDLENAVAEGRDKKLGELGVPVISLLICFVSHEQNFCFRVTALQFREVHSSRQMYSNEFTGPLAYRCDLDV